MSNFTLKHATAFLLSLYTYSLAEQVYTVEKEIVPECHITLQNTLYTRISNETQIFGSQWNNKQKISFTYDQEGKQSGYTVINWSNTSNSWADSMYCMFFYNTRKQPSSYQVSPVHGDTVDQVLYKEYYSYNDTTTKLNKIMTLSQNSEDSLVLSAEEHYIYSQNAKLDSVITINYDEDYRYIWSTVREKLVYTNDTMYSIFERTSYLKHPDSPAVTFDVEHRYQYSSDGKKSVQGKCLLAGIQTERILYTYRAEDGLPEMDLSQEIASIAAKTYKDTSRVTYSYTFQNQLVIKTATTEILSSGNWTPVSRKIDTYYSEQVSSRKNSPTAADRDYKIVVQLSHSPIPALSVSSPERMSSIELFSVNGALLHKERNIRSGNEIRLDIPCQKIANYSSPMVVNIQFENGFHTTRRIFLVR